MLLLDGSSQVRLLRAAPADDEQRAVTLEAPNRREEDIEPFVRNQPSDEADEVLVVTSEQVLTDLLRLSTPPVR